MNSTNGTEGVRGYGQDEDQEELGAWYTMAATVFLDVKVFTNENPQMQLESPMRKIPLCLIFAANNFSSFSELS